MLLQLQHLGALTPAVGSLYHAHRPPSGEEPFPNLQPALPLGPVTVTIAELSASTPCEELQAAVRPPLSLLCSGLNKSRDLSHHLAPQNLHHLYSLLLYANSSYVLPLIVAPKPALHRTEQYNLFPHTDGSAGPHRPGGTAGPSGYQGTLADSYLTCKQPGPPDPFPHGCSPASCSPVCTYIQGCPVRILKNIVLIA